MKLSYILITQIYILILLLDYLGILIGRTRIATAKHCFEEEEKDEDNDQDDNEDDDGTDYNLKEQKNKKRTKEQITNQRIKEGKQSLHIAIASELWRLNNFQNRPSMIKVLCRHLSQGMANDDIQLSIVDQTLEIKCDTIDAGNMARLEMMVIHEH